MLSIKCGPYIPKGPYAAHEQELDGLVYSRNATTVTPSPPSWSSPGRYMRT